MSAVSRRNTVFSPMKDFEVTSSMHELTNEARAEMSLLNLCRARRKKTKSTATEINAHKRTDDFAVLITI